jgi:hypothetical protein
VAALRASETAFWLSYTSRMHAPNVARTPFQTVSRRSSSQDACSKHSAERGIRMGRTLVRGPLVRCGA